MREVHERWGVRSGVEVLLWDVRFRELLRGGGLPGAAVRVVEVYGVYGGRAVRSWEEVLQRVVCGGGLLRVERLRRGQGLHGEQLQGVRCEHGLRGWERVLWRGLS
jgi:hypothetical protein